MRKEEVKKMKEEKNIDFDCKINRYHTDSLKYDFAKEKGKPEDVLPLWVADMDFMTSSFILDAIEERNRHGIYGYTDTLGSYEEAVLQWMKQHFHWEPQKESLVKTPGVVFALAMAVQAYTKEGESVLIQEPVYYPFRSVIEDNGRIAISNDLVQGADGTYEIDFEKMEQLVIDHQISLFLLCSPHNPVGRVWTKDELRKIGDICKKHQVLVVSDEIHQDFVFGDKQHIPFVKAVPEMEEYSIVCTSPAKTFNIAGLQVSNIFIANEILQKKFLHRMSCAGYSQLNTLALTAGEAAYRFGEQWYQQMLAYIQGNVAFLREYLQTNLPQIRLVEPEGTYLMWLDCKALQMTEEERTRFLLEKAKVWTNTGTIFGACGKGFERINIACPRQTLEQGLEQIKNGLEER